MTLTLIPERLSDVPNVVVKGLGRVFFPDSMGEREIADALAAKSQQLLDMSEAARMKRADDIGFFQEKVFHGTAAKPTTTTPGGNLFEAFEKFEGKDLSRSVSRSPVGKLGVSVAEQPEVAGEFAKLASPGGGEGAAIVPLKFRADNVASLSLDGSESNAEIFGTVTDAWNQGFDAIQFTNYTTPETIDTVTKKVIPGVKGSFVLVKNPNQLRSVNAAFDPTKRESSDLLASIIPAAAGLGAIAAPDKSFADELTARQNETPGQTGDRLLQRRADTITPDEFPKLQQIGDFIDKFGQTPLGPAFTGITDYLRGFGEDVDSKEKAKRALLAAIDLI